jgi:hypothetical protein
MPPTPSDTNVAVESRSTEPGASVGIFLGLLAALAVFSHSSTPLLRYPDRAIGVGLMGGVDPARRFPLYVTLVALVLGVWLACHYGVRWLQCRRPDWFSGVRTRLENDLCALFASVGSVALVARVSADRLDRLGPTMACLAALGTVLGVALVRRLCPRVSWFPRQLGSLSTLAMIVLLAWPAAQISAVLANVQSKSDIVLLRLGTILLPLSYALALGHFLRHPGKAKRSDVSRAFVLAAAPLFVFPTLCPVANEIQFSLAQRRVVEPRSVALVLLAVLVVVSAVLFWRARAGKLRVPSGRVLARYIFPFVIFGETLISVYKHTLDIKRVDPLHDGEQITAVHQLLQFDKWPFVDVWPAHGLFDYVGALYSLVNGFHPLELTAWNGLLAALSATAVYAILANIGTPWFAFMVAALLPIEAILPLPMYSFFYAEPGLLAVGLLACLVLDTRRGRGSSPSSLWGYALLSLAASLCFFWTPTSGVASIVAVLGLIVLGLITASDRRPLWRGLAVFVATGLAVFVAYALVLALRGRPVFETLGLIRAFMQADPLIGGRATVLDKFDTPAFVQYLILPGIGLVYLARLACHAIERRPLGHVERLLGFLTLVSFVLFARTLTRHGILERYQPFYFVLLALCVWMPRGSRAPLSPLGARPTLEGPRGELAAHFWHRAGARAWFCLGLALYLVWSPQPSHKQPVFEAFQFHTWQAEERRFNGHEPNYSKLRAFLSATLGPRDTFLEMLNMPVLYGLLDREVPGQFFLPTMFYATDSVQKSYLARLEAFGGSARVPVVLLPGDKGSNIDGIENTLRSYRIAEHIYRNYVPFVTIDGFEVWISRVRWDEAAQKITPRPLSFRDPSGYRTHSVKPPRLESGVLQIAAAGPDPRVEDFVEVKGVPLGGVAVHHAVRFSYRASVAGELELFYRFIGGNYNAADSARTKLLGSPSGEWQSAEIAIPAKADPKVAIHALRIDPPEGAALEIKDLTLVFGQPTVPDPERYLAGMLPFFWGNFDDHQAAREAHVVESIALPNGNSPLAAFDLKFNPIADKSAGNYLMLCIRLPAIDTVTKSRRWHSVDHDGSWQGAGTVTVSYGAAPPSSFTFDLVQPTPGAPGLPEALTRSFTEECKPYLVRLSAQYVWNSQAISSVSVASSVPVVLEMASVLMGD